MGIFKSIFSEVVGGILNQDVDKLFNSQEVNLKNAYGRLKPICETKYQNFKSNPKSFLADSACLWFMRKDFEAARYYYTGGKEGYQVSERVNGNGFYSDKQFKEYFEATEEKLKEMEKAKGYEFIEVKDNNIIFKESSTGEVLSADESNNI